MKFNILNYSIALFLMFAMNIGQSSAQDTVWVNTLNFEDITKRRGTWMFPEEGSWEKILMFYTLKCDPRTTQDRFACGEWDYLTYNIIHDTIGKIDTNWVVKNYEIGRFITPYGINLDLGPNGFKWVYDVTDYAPILKGLVTMSAGNQQELIDLRFAFIKGTPPREVKKIHFLRDYESRQYRFIADNTRFPADTIDLLPDSKGFRLMTRITGHGHEGTYDPGNNKIHCCEWANKLHHLNIDGQKAFEWDIWQNDLCALNPVDKQGGNWAPPRAGWCPGAPVPDYNFELTSLLNGKNQTIIDYGIEPVPADNPGQGTGNYVVSLHLFEYGPINHVSDIEVEDILVPNSWELHRKLNPTCDKPKVKIRNKGSETLTECTIWYGVKGGHTVRYTWRGTLGFMESEIVDLPFEIWDWKGADKSQEFVVRVEAPNGKTDQNPQNDEAMAMFEIPRTVPRSVAIWWRNNNLSGDVDLKITDEADNVVYEKNNLSGGEIFNDALNLNPGCHKLSVITKEGFGLSYPLISQVGSGFLRLRYPDGPIIENINPDFGKSVEYYFTVAYPLNTEPQQPELQAVVYPNPAANELNIDLQGHWGTGVEVSVFDLQGRQIGSAQTFDVTTGASFLTLPVSTLAPGMYTAIIRSEKGQQSLKWTKI